MRKAIWIVVMVAVLISLGALAARAQIQPIQDKRLIELQGQYLELKGQRVELENEKLAIEANMILLDGRFRERQAMLEEIANEVETVADNVPAESPAEEAAEEKAIEVEMGG